MAHTTWIYADGSGIGEMLIDAQMSRRFGQVYFTVSSAIIVVYVFSTYSRNHMKEMKEMELF